MLRALVWPTPTVQMLHPLHLKKKTLKHPILTLTGLYFPPLSSSILEEEIILLAEQLVSIAAFS